MSKRYIYVHEQDRSREYLHVRTAVRDGAREVRIEGAVYHVGIEGQNVGRPRDFDNAQWRARELLKTKSVGQTVRIEARIENQRVALVRFRKVETYPEPYQGPGVEGIDRFEGYVRDKFPRARWAGTCVCKPLDHGDCAAIDYFASAEEMEAMRDEAIRNATYFRTKYVILYRTIYFESDGFKPHFYSGDYHTHIHVSVYGGIPRSAC